MGNLLSSYFGDPAPRISRSGLSKLEPLTPLHSRPDELQASLARLKANSTHWVDFSAHLDVKTKLELRNALNDIGISQSVITFFSPFPAVIQASFRIHDMDSLDRLLRQDWFLRVDFMPDVTFGAHSGPHASE